MEIKRKGYAMNRIDIWDDLPSEVKETLETLGRSFNGSQSPTKELFKASIEGYVLALQDTKIITRNEGLSLETYVKSIR